jgi:hypothetical protein
MNNERIDLTQFEGIMGVEWLFDEQLFVGKQNRWRFAINEYTDTETMSEKEYEEWENGLEPVWASLTSAVAYLPNLLSELKRCYEELDEYDELVGLLIENHFVESSPYETVKHLIETHQDYRASE